MIFAVMLLLRLVLLDPELPTCRGWHPPPQYYADWEVAPVVRLHPIEVTAK